MDAQQKVTVSEARERMPQGWRQVLQAVRARYATPDFVTGVRFVNEVAELAEAAQHHPEVSLAYSSVELRLTSHDVGGLTGRDLDLAAQIAQAAQSLGLSPEPSAITQVELGLDSDAAAALSEAYAALLGTTVVRGEEAVDPDGRQPTVWFQDSDPAFVGAPGAPEQRWHLDVWVAEDEGQARVDAFVAAGGVLVDDSQAPAFWVVADAEGNRSCVCTVSSRG